MTVSVRLCYVVSFCLSVLSCRCISFPLVSCMLVSFMLVAFIVVSVAFPVLYVLLSFYVVLFYAPLCYFGGTLGFIGALWVLCGGPCATKALGEMGVACATKALTKTFVRE